MRFFHFHFVSMQLLNPIIQNLLICRFLSRHRHENFLIFWWNCIIFYRMVQLTAAFFNIFENELFDMAIVKKPCIYCIFNSIKLDRKWGQFLGGKTRCWWWCRFLVIYGNLETFVFHPLNVCIWLCVHFLLVRLFKRKQHLPILLYMLCGIFMIRDLFFFLLILCWRDTRLLLNRTYVWFFNVIWTAEQLALD